MKTIFKSLITVLVLAVSMVGLASDKAHVKSKFENKHTESAAKVSGAAAAIELLAARKQANEMQPAGPSQHEGRHVIVNNDGNYVMVITSDDVLTLYDRRTQATLYRPQVKVIKAGFGGDFIYYESEVAKKDRFATKKEKSVGLYNITTKKDVMLPDCSAPKVSPNGKWLVVTGKETDENGTVYFQALLCLASMKQYVFEGNDGWFSPDSSRYFVNNNAEMKLEMVDLQETGSEELHSVERPYKDLGTQQVYKMQIGADRAFVVNDTILCSVQGGPANVFKGTVKLYNNGAIVAQAHGSFDLICKHGAFKFQGQLLDVSRESDRVLIEINNQVIEYSLLTKTQNLIAPQCEFPWVEYTMDGLKFALKDFAGNAYLVSLTENKLFAHYTGITRMDFSPDRSIIVFEQGEKVFVHEAKTGRLLQTIEGSFYTFTNNILILAGGLVKDSMNRHHSVHDFSQYACKELVHVGNAAAAQQK